MSCSHIFTNNNADIDITQYLESLSKKVKLFISIALILIIGASDYGIDLVSEGQISFSIFYLIPISFATWYLDSRAGIILSVLAASVWHIAGAFSGYFHYNSLLSVWNTIVRFGFFLIVVLALSRLRVEIENKSNLLFALQSTLSELKRADEELKRKAEELARSNAELEQFALAAAHDLRSPLVTIGGYIKMLRSDYKDKLDEEAMSMISDSLQGIKRMELLIQGLLSYARIGSGVKEFQLVDLNRSFTYALSNLDGLIEESQARITFDPLSTIMADDMQIIQLFQNLLGNAMQYCTIGENPNIHISSKKKEKEWVFSVKDNGIGIEAEHHESIFGLFQRIKGASSNTGTGIGLALCKKIVEQHGGRIWVESEKGQGSVFYFTIPCASADEAMAP